MADFLLFSDANFSLHRNYKQEDLNWVQDHSLLVVEAKKLGEIPSILGQPVYYTMWSKAVAYLVVDGEYIKGYYYNEIIKDRKKIDCRISDLLKHNEIWEFAYRNIFYLKQRNLYRIPITLTDYENSQSILDREIEETIFCNGIKEDDCKSALEKDLEKVEVENFIHELQKNMDLLVDDEFSVDEKMKKICGRTN